MKRQLFGAGLLALVAANAGCNPGFVAGRCDCQYNPANAVIAPASNPYPVIGGPGGAAVAPSAPAAPAAPATLPMTTPKVAPAAKPAY